MVKTLVRKQNAKDVRSKRVHRYKLHPSAELKYSESATALGVNTTGFVGNQLNVGRGDDLTQRKGREVITKLIEVNFHIFRSDSATPTASANIPIQTTRIILFYDKQANGAVPAITAVLDTSDPLSHYNYANRNRFVVIKDWTFIFDQYFSGAANANGNSSNSIFNRQLKIPCNLKTVFNSNNAADITDIASGSICLLGLGSLAASATTQAAIVGRFRVRFTDT